VKAFLYHVQINVSDAAISLPFYRALFAYLEYTTIMETRDVLAVSNGTTDFWLIETPAERRDAAFHRKNTGLNHVAFGVRERGDIDRFVEEFLRPRGITPLYGSPHDHPEYRPGYYAVFFEDPDRLKVEIAHVPGLTDKPRR
jgi:catechol 2,3-dioxygenase-like lactoylglutathione lyase family enzyme